MTEIYNKKYASVGIATFGHRVFKEGLIPAAALQVDTVYTSAALAVNFQGFARQAFKVYPKHAGAGSPTVDVEIQEWVPDPADPNNLDSPFGFWATKGSLGVGSAAKNVIFEHHQEDVLRWARLKLTPKVGVPDGGIHYELSGRLGQS